MTTYNTYQEAKIANPNEHVYKLLSNGEFISFDKEAEMIRDVIQDSDAALCNPADHCMTVEQFLKAGHKFVVGDVYLSTNGVVSCCDSNFPPPILNEPNKFDSDRYILRAAALEEKSKEEIDYDKGMRKAMKKIAKSCGRSFCVDIGYEDLPDLVESLINPKSEEKPKRVNVEYVKVEESIFDLRKDFESGFLFGDSSGLIKVDCLAYLGACCETGNIYRQVKTEISERDEFIEVAYKSMLGIDRAMDVCEEHLGAMFDSGKFKLVRGE